MMNGDPDELFSLKNHLWIGNFETAIREGKHLTSGKTLPSPMDIERDVYLYRAQLALGQFDTVLQAIEAQEKRRGFCPSPFAALRLLALSLQDPEAHTDVIMANLQAWMQDPHVSTNPHVLLIAGLLYSQQQKFSDAFSALQRPDEATLEHYALRIQLYLQLHRIELAKKVHDQMKKIDEDATLTQLVSAWIALQSGEEHKCEEASMVFQELGERFGTSLMTLNGQMVALMHVKHFSEAEQVLDEALANMNSSLVCHATTQRSVWKNAVTIKSRLGKHDAAQEFLELIRTQDPNDAQVVTSRALSKTFDTLAMGFQT